MLAHYIIVRRDLPLGVLAAMVTHAAGESAAKYGRIRRFKGSVAVVLEVKNERKLLETSLRLDRARVKYVAIEESSGPYGGQYMAIGIVPCERKKVAGVLSDYQTLKKLDIPESPSVNSQNPNEADPQLPI